MAVSRRGCTEEKRYIGALSQARDKLLLQYWCHCALLTAGCKSRVAVMYRFTNTCHLCSSYGAAVVHLSELNKLRKLVQTCLQVNALKKTYLRAGRHRSRPGEMLHSGRGCVRQLVTCLRSCARLALCLEVVVAADFPDSLGIWAECCVPHNGSTHRQQTSSLFTVHLPVVFFSGTLTPLSLPLCSGTDSGLFFSFCIVASIQTQGMAAAFSRLTHTVVSCVKCDFSPDMHSPHTSLKASPSHRFWSAYCLAFPGRSVGSTRLQF